MVAGESSAGISCAAELRRVHPSAGNGPEGRPEVGGEESVEDRIEAGVAVGQAVGDDLEDDESAQLDVVDAEALQQQNNLE